MEIAVWMIEDDQAFRETILSLVNQTEDLRADGEFSTCEEALVRLENESTPDVILMDIGLPGMDGIEGLRQIKAKSPGTDIIMLTVYEKNDTIFKAICNGASGYLLKGSPAEKIVDAIREVFNGGAPINAQIARKVLDMFSRINSRHEEYELTKREQQILRLLVDGVTTGQIAEKLFLSYYTVDAHIKNIYLKLQVHTRSGAVAKALKERLV